MSKNCKDEVTWTQVRYLFCLTCALGAIYGCAYALYKTGVYSGREEADKKAYVYGYNAAVHTARWVAAEDTKCFKIIDNKLEQLKEE